MRRNGRADELREHEVVKLISKAELLNYFRDDDVTSIAMLIYTQASIGAHHFRIPPTL